MKKFKILCISALLLGLMAGPANNEVEVRVSRADVPVILAAQSAELPLSLVGAAL